MQVLVFCDFGWKTPIHAPFCGGFGAQFPKKMPSLGGTTSFEPYCTNIGRAVQAGRVKKKKDRTGKSHKWVIFHPFGEKTPTEAIYITNCVLSDVLGVITCYR